MSRTPLWRKALPNPPTGKANMRVYVKHGLLGDVHMEEVVELKEIGLDEAKEIMAVVRRELVTKEDKVVHVLMAGSSLCLMPGVPRDWPKGHVWVSYVDRNSATCATCIEEANAIDKRTRHQVTT